MIRKLLALLLVLALLPCAALAEEDTVLPAGPLPIDFTPGMKPDAALFTADSYEDPSISVKIETGRMDKCDFWVATIKIADASQLRTRSAGGFDSTSEMKGTAMATENNAVVAINGDYYCFTEQGLIIREGQLYRNILQGDRDVLLIDEDGDFHTYVLPNQDEVPTETVDGKKIIQAFYFGPVLVSNGEVNPKVDVNRTTHSVMAATEKRQRMAICQVGPLEYKLVCCAAPARGSYGMTLQQFASLVAQQGVQTAYNLDGGDSCMLIFNGEKINDVRNKSTRKIVDIIYFATAIPEVN